ncbi:hypothetical protein M0805_002915 [Coniferiporia weirii]|nr:hypothetical protein M0805_002915 [Coniferiporia weirii]
MVVVLDAIQSEKFSSDPLADAEVQSLLPANVHDVPAYLDKLPSRRGLSRKGRWALKIGLVVFALALYRMTGMRRASRDDFELLSSIARPGSEDRRFGSLSTLLDPEKTEKLFLSIPSSKSALAASRKYATHPHIAGSVEDYDDAKAILELFQTQFGISMPEDEPIFSAGSPESQKATLDISTLSTPQAWIDVYYPVMNMPLDRSLEILDADGEVSWAADLVEDGDPGDPDAAKYRDAVPTFHGLSKGGDVEGELIYANYGTKDDYDTLVASGADLTGKIVIVRYGAIFRGLKIKGAQELGAVGVLIYSDPRDDGAVTIENGYKPYPAGPARNPTSVQRGSVQFISMYPGDPTTPGYPAYENSTRTEGLNKPSIPSLPISWQNAEKLLEELGSPQERRTLTGKASQTKVKLVNHVDEKVMPIWNTMAVIPGHIKDEVVMVGNHRDAWVMGAADPTSGVVSLHEIVRGFGALLRSGWKPLRTIVFASWDAEEYGLIGSTEWGEDFADWIKDHVVAYLQTDVSSAGSRFSVSASPSLSQLIAKTAKDLPHPAKSGKSLWDAIDDDGPFAGAIDPDLKAQHDAKSTFKHGVPGVSPLGSGSDYTVFLQHIGIASVDCGFSGTLNDAVYHYHSVYDSERWQELYGDPGFHRHVAVAQNLGLLALRFADAITLPLNTTQYALELDDYLDLVEDIASTQTESTDFSALRESIGKLQKASLALDAEKEEAEADLRKLLEEIRKDVLKSQHRGHHMHRGVWGRVRSSISAFFGVPPPPPPPPPPFHRGEEHGHFVGGPVAEMLGHGVGPGRDDALDEDGAEMAPAPLHGHPHAPPPPPPGHGPFGHHLLGNVPIRKFLRAVGRVRRTNKKLSSFERGFISEGGLKDREWYLHLGVAPGKWLGYGATTLPALTEALTIEQNATLAQYEAGRLQTLIDRLAAEIDV